MSNAKVVKISKLVDGIDIMINNGQQEKRFSFDSKNNNEDEILKSSPNNLLTLTIILLNKITSTSNIDLNNNVKQLCDFCIESKYTKIVRHKKITFIIHKVQEIYTDL